MHRALRVAAILVALLFLLIGAKSTLAQTTFTFDWTGGYGTGVGIFNTTNDGVGVYTITSITGGTQNGLSISLLPPSGYGGNDNLLYYPGTPLVFDFPGVSFNDGTDSFNIYNNGGLYFECSSASTVCEGGDGLQLTSLSVTPTPEPRTFLLVLPAFLAFLFFAFRKGFGAAV
jgi:hypothetical protein